MWYYLFYPLIWIIAFVVHIPFVLLRRGGPTTELDVLNAMDHTEWRTAGEIGAQITLNNREFAWIALHRHVDCYAPLIKFVKVGLANERKRNNGPIREYVLTPDGVKHRYVFRVVKTGDVKIPAPSKV